MLGPNYHNWWKERPIHARLRLGLIILPVLLVILWILVQYVSGVYLRAQIRDAVNQGKIERIRALIEKGAPTDITYSNGKSLLHQALVMKYKNIVPLLIEAGADVNAKDNRGITPIHFATGQGYADIVRQLIAKGADTNARSEIYGSPLHKAARQGSYPMAALLIQHRAEVSARTPGFTITPLHQAVRFGHEEIVRLLLNNGAEVDAFSPLYGTPLHWAAEAGKHEIASVLLEQGASVTALDSHGLSPAERARLGGHPALALFLAPNKELPQQTEPGGKIGKSKNQGVQANCILPQRMQRFGRMLVDAYVDKMSIVKTRARSA